MSVRNAASVVGYNTKQTTFSISVLLESTRMSIPWLEHLLLGIWQLSSSVQFFAWPQSFIFLAFRFVKYKGISFLYFFHEFAENH